MGIKAAQPYADEYGIDLGEMKAALQTAGTKKSVPMSKTAVRAKGESMMLGKLQELVDSRRAKNSSVTFSSAGVGGVLTIVSVSSGVGGVVPIQIASAAAANGSVAVFG